MSGAIAFERRVTFSPSFDRRDPNPSKNYGIGAIRIWFYLIGPKGAVQWQIGTTWYVPSAQEHLRAVRGPMLNTREESLGGTVYQPQAWDLGYHAREPQYEGQAPISHECEVIGGTCYYDGSSLNAERLIVPFLEGGDEAVWRELEAYYHSVFDTVEAA